MNTRIFPALLMVFLLCCACNGGGKSEGVPNISGEQVISGLSDTQWTYFSFETGDVVGTSTFASDEEDEVWSKRKDWDFAICGDYLKTNGGTSGEGLGGIQRDSTATFATIVEAPSTGYLLDSFGEVK